MGDFEIHVMCVCVCMCSYVVHVQVVGEGVPHVDSESTPFASQSMETPRSKTPVMAAGDRVSTTGCVKQACIYMYM